MKRRFYENYQKASAATQLLGINTGEEYLKRYKEDPLLPSSPHRVYKNNWNGWPRFLGKSLKFYNTYDEASQAAQSFGIKTGADYLAQYKKDPRLPSCPNKIYKKEWKSWPSFLGISSPIYETYDEASQAAQSLGIKFYVEYKKRYKEDPLLPSAPDKVYSADWKSWPDFLDKFYKKCALASRAALLMGIHTIDDYQKRYKEDPRLPSAPHQMYADEWVDWSHFFGRSKKKLYRSYEEASEAARKLGIRRCCEYKKRYKEDPRLPSDPQIQYDKEWKSYYAFLGQPPKKTYRTLTEASKAAQKLGIHIQTEYRKRYKEDPYLPANPNFTYENEWKNWPDFLGGKAKILYEFYIEAQEAAQLLGVKTRREYKSLKKLDERLPANPEQVYKEEWHSWNEFLGTGPRAVYSKYLDAKNAVQTLGIKRREEYRERYKEDSLLPSNPRKTYKKDWVGWVDFFLPVRIFDLESFKRACDVLNVKNSIQYKEARKKYKQIPSKPEKVIQGWCGWYKVLGIPQPYIYEELRKIVINNFCRTMGDYQLMRAKLKDPRIPASPEEYYKDKGWTNTFDFFGKPRPYQVKYFNKGSKLWGEKITEFLRTARGGDTKAKDLCEFVREYIEPNGFESSPLDFLTRNKTNIQPMMELLEQSSVSRKKKWIYSINEFLNWIITKYLTIEDSETGEVSRIKGAKNPFSNKSFDDEKYPQVASETNKLALPYQFVKDGREWIFPPVLSDREPTYSDLKHLHTFSADWVLVDDYSLIDKSDNDCVVKTEGGKTYLWLPIYWTYTYALMQLPARGIQIVYSDSGEADFEVAEYEKGCIVWEKNKGSLAGLTNYQGIVCKVGKDDFGVHYTSNKTNFSGRGFSVPFMPIELAYWLIKLRKWQQKYNKIVQPTSWVDCQRTNLNEVQRKQKGTNCFLFRDFKDIEPGYFGGRLTHRLATALFFSSRGEVTTATYSGRHYNECFQELEKKTSISLYLFKSDYTPHSMRVSLINAYAYEFGIPLEVIMKLVGHSSIIMSIYYVKSDKTGANIRERIERGEKEALSNAAKTFKSYVEQQCIEECKSQLVASSPEFLATLDNSRPASNYLFKDFGMCPVGGAFCSEGGQSVATKANIYHPVPAGYLGEQNCVHCRFFITGPAFMVGLAALFNEVSLAVNTQSFRYSKLEAELNQTAQEIEVISHKLYERKTSDVRLERDRKDLISQRQKLNSEIETRAKKLDLYMSDMNAVHRHIYHCQQVLEHQMHSNEASKLQLIVPRQVEIDVELDEVSRFHQLSEVCENAELYHSCSDELAVTRRSQALDQMMVRNNMPARMFLLSEEEQLAVGNQLTQLMLSRLESWESVDRLMDGRLSMMDLSEDTKLTVNTIQELFERSQPLKRIK